MSMCTNPSLSQTRPAAGRAHPRQRVQRAELPMQCRSLPLLCSGAGSGRSSLCPCPPGSSLHQRQCRAPAPDPAVPVPAAPTVPVPACGCRTALFPSRPGRADSFDKGEYEKAVEQQNLAKTIVEVLYPNDNHYAGKELRLRQQYFFISASVQRAILKFKEKNSDIHKLPEKITFQMNDTHPTVAVAELMRILMDEEGLEWDDAWDITTRTCAYTNHTIMAEALEKWPIELFSRLLPRIYQIVEEINRRFVLKIQSMYPGNQDKVKNMAILYDGQVKMAHLAIAGSYSVNGVAALHTKILEERELKDFYEMRPEQFNNKTNGITQRRFLLHGNPLLASWITDKIGDEWIVKLSNLKKLKVYATDEKYQQEFRHLYFQFRCLWLRLELEQV